MVAGIDMLDVVRPALYKVILEEAAGQRIPELNEPGWTDMFAQGSAQSLTNLKRDEVNAQAVRYYYTDPTAQHMIRLHNAYTFGRGVSIHASDPEVNATLEAFWNNPRNRVSLSSAKAQWKQNRDLQLKGELFFIFYTSTLTGAVTIRTIKPEEITKITYAPGDAEMPLYFVREFNDKQGKKITWNIPDYRFADVGNRLKYLDGSRNTEACMMHVIAEEFDGRGISSLTPSIPWIKALKGFMEDRATLSLALATFAFRQKVKGNRQALERLAAQWGEYETTLRYGYNDTRERRQGANTLIENEAATLEQFKTDSGASNAYQDMRMFRQQAGIGASIFEHYLGDPSTGNLATATAMELPMLKVFEFGQQAWTEVFTDITGFVIRQAIRFASLQGKGKVDIDFSGGAPLWSVIPAKSADLNVDIVFPPVVQRDIAVWSSALAQIGQIEQALGQMLVPADQKAQIALSLFGVRDISGTLEEMRKDNFSLAAAEPVEPTVESIKRAIQKLKEAKKPGKALPKKEAEKTEPVTKKEIDKAFDDWREMPSLEALAKELGITLDELDNA